MTGRTGADGDFFALELVGPGDFWELAEQFGVVHGIGFVELPGNPGDVHVVVQMNVLAGGVAGPGAAADRGGHRHAVVHAAGVGLRLGLTDHDAADTRHRGETVDVDRKSVV